MKKIIIAIALLLTGCWDMRADVWEKAKEMCEPHGGLMAADSDHYGRTAWHVEALCADMSIVKKVVRI